MTVRPPHTVRRRYGGGGERLSTTEVGGATGADVLAAGELDILDRGPAQTVGAQAGLVAVSDGTGEVDEVFVTWGDAMGLESFPTSLTDRFLDRAFGSERAVLEPFSCGPGAG